MDLNEPLRPRAPAASVTVSVTGSRVTEKAEPLVLSGRVSTSGSLRGESVPQCGQHHGLGSWKE